jgi:hypothetical protein
MCNLLLRCIVLCLGSLSFEAGLYVAAQGRPERARVDSPVTWGKGAVGQQGLGEPRRSRRETLIGDFPEYRPGARAAGAETFWR